MSPEEVIKVFMNTPLEENYNFAQEDLVKLANAFVAAAKPGIEKAERKECLKIVSSLNSMVAQKLEEVRGRA